MFGKGKNHVKYKILDSKESGGWGLSNLRIYLAVCLVLMKEWLLLRNKRLLELGGHDLRFGRHA